MGPRGTKSRQATPDDDCRSCFVDRSRMAPGPVPEALRSLGVHDLYGFSRLADPAGRVIRLSKLTRPKRGLSPFLSDEDGVVRVQGEVVDQYQVLFVCDAVVSAVLRRVESFVVPSVLVREPELVKRPLFDGAE